MHNLRLVYILFFAFVLSSCDSSTDEPIAKNGYPGKVSVIIESNCLGGSCHSSSTKENGGLDLSSWDAMMRGDSVTNDVLPFNARLSYLFQHINTNRDLGEKALPRMPLARDPLHEVDQITIYDWINDGARSSDGRIAYSTVVKKYFVPNQGEDVLSVIDGETNRLIRAEQFVSGSQPAAVAINPAKEFVYLGFQDNKGTVKQIRISDYVVTGEFSSGLVPKELTITPDGTKGYISSYPSAFKNRIGVFDPVAKKMTKTIETPLIRSSVAMVCSKDGKYLYVSGYESDNILVIDTKTDTVVTNLLMDASVPAAPTDAYSPKYQPVALALSNDGKYLFAAAINLQRVYVFDLETNAVKTFIPVEIFPRGMKAAPGTNELWVVNAGSNAISIIDMTSLEVTTIIETVGSEPSSVEFSPDGSLAYVACLSKSGSSHHQGGNPKSAVFVLNRATRKIIKEIEMPTFSAGIARGF
ncbi:MAG TPA: beta-propeller fold lactonase family protein [Candidatus Kapabacteria bacterium]